MNFSTTTIPMEVISGLIVTVFVGLIGWGLKQSITGLVTTIKDLIKVVNGLSGDVREISQTIKQHAEQLKEHDGDIKELMKGNYGNRNGKTN